MCHSRGCFVVGKVGSKLHGSPSRGFYSFPASRSDMVTRPSESADSVEIARWMEEDFWEHVIEASKEASEDDTSSE